MNKSTFLLILFTSLVAGTVNPKYLLLRIKDGIKSKARQFGGPGFGGPSGPGFGSPGGPGSSWSEQGSQHKGTGWLIENYIFYSNFFDFSGIFDIVLYSFFTYNRFKLDTNNAIWKSFGCFLPLYHVSNLSS